ncbi:winged helix-turn-helix domain-containing protein [Streptomyces sp. P38-E01]|uniref:Winged helix-turn-helix domain-containing protein n=1 Tax=Streptomyces tardus TaxID=2780544 RepID=A0A949N1U9_9ACTN|nr:winged helix-turn-helix domain-containing protein [Streptomyces tardus]MBU7598250.1 winged helix-turn-helix domain-containing protein [Streptomyces tardus]
MAEGRLPTGDELLKALAALANPHRIRIIGALFRGRNYVSRLAREIGMSRPLLHMHLQRLEAAGLIVGSLELSAGGKATRYFEVAPFVYELTPETIARATSTLTHDTDRRSAEPSGPPGAEPAPQRTAARGHRHRSTTPDPGCSGRSGQTHPPEHTEKEDLL